MSDIEETSAGWYFYMQDRICKIGPYSSKKTCQVDYDRYIETGRISIDPRGNIGAKCADCED
jgi:hypothetical protein